MQFHHIYGVDFSGAKLAGRNTWIARLEPSTQRKRAPFYQLTELESLERACGMAERSVALAYLVDRIAASDRALWAIDFPFGLPAALMEGCWTSQFDLLYDSGEDDYGLGLECIRRAKALGLRMHVRRLTDVEVKAPFDPYHYRIIYQTFYGMRDVLGPLRHHRGTAILPFHYRRLPTARRVLVEACPASTLKRLGLPHQNYKQPEGGPLIPKRLRARRAILAGLRRHVRMSETHRRVIMRNGGGDALDAVIAALGGIQSWHHSDHRHIARHSHYPREGRLFV